MDHLDLDEYPPVVIDNGSSTCRAGFAGDEAPQAIFSNVIGRRRYEIGLNSKNYIGDEAQDKRELLTLTYPVKHGIVVNWDDMETIWNHVFYSELKCSPTEHPVHFSEPPFNPKGYREKLSQVMFETYQVPGFHLAFEAAMVVMAAGRNCGTVLNVGESCTYVASFWESYTPLDSVNRLDFGGEDLTRYLQHLLHKRGYSFTTTSELEIVREMKEQLCTLAPHKNSQIESNPITKGQAETYKLPDGTSVNIGQDRYACPELLFEPDGVFNTSTEGIADMVYNSVMSCEMDCRKDIYSSIILCGGSTFFPGMRDRMHAELEERHSSGNQIPPRIRVLDKPERKYHVWIGGSIQASLSTFARCWVTKAEYEESGPRILNSKCF